MTFGYSRDDVGKFLPVYMSKGILQSDPFEVCRAKEAREIKLVSNLYNDPSNMYNIVVLGWFVTGSGPERCGTTHQTSNGERP